jgi:hypothetical protein
MSSKKLVKNFHSGLKIKQAANYIEKFFCVFRGLYTVTRKQKTEVREQTNLIYCLATVLVQV